MTGEQWAKIFELDPAYMPENLGEICIELLHVVTRLTTAYDWLHSPNLYFGATPAETLKTGPGAEKVLTYLQFMRPGA